MNEQQTEPEKPVSSTPKKSAIKFKMTWWLWAIIVIAIAAIAVSLVLKFTTNSTATTKPDTAEEITVKQYLSSLRGDIVRYHEEKQTYAGWSANTTAIDQVKKMGSELKTQALSKDTYIIYAKMPGSKTVFCLDHTGFTSEVTSLSPWAKACQ